MADVTRRVNLSSLGSQAHDASSPSTSAQSVLQNEVNLRTRAVQILWAKREAIYKREIGETPGRMKGARTKLTISKQGHC